MEKRAANVNGITPVHTSNDVQCDVTCERRVSTTRVATSATMTLTCGRRGDCVTGALMDDGKTSPRIRRRSMRRAPVVQLTSSQRPRGQGVSADLIYCPVCHRLLTKSRNIDRFLSCFTAALSKRSPRASVRSQRRLQQRRSSL